MSVDRVDRTRAVTDRLTKRDPRNRKSVRERLRKRWQLGSERVEMSADRVDRTRAFTTRLTKRDPTNRKSVRERLRKIWQMGFNNNKNSLFAFPVTNDDRNVGGSS